MEITQNQIGTLKQAVDFLRAGISPDKAHRPVLADAISAALEMLEATEPFETYNPEIFDECGGVRLDLIKPAEDIICRRCGTKHKDGVFNVCCM